MSRSKKIGLILAIFGGLIITLYIIGRVTGAIQMYSIPTNGNNPTIKRGDGIFASNLPTAKRFDFICYYYTDSLFGPEKQTFIFRLCGLPGDILQIKDGQLYVNSKPADAPFTLGHEYSIPDTSFARIRDLLTFTDDETPYPNDGNQVLPLDKEKMKQLTDLGIPYKQFIHKEDYADEQIQKLFNLPWNQDHFGPVTVPKDHYFVLGDNRHRAMDSRYTGFIPQKDVRGVVVRRY